MIAVFTRKRAWRAGAIALVVVAVLTGCMNYLNSLEDGSDAFAMELRLPLLFDVVADSNARFIVPTADEARVSVEGERNDYSAARRVRLTVEENEIVGHVEFEDVPRGYSYLVTAVIADSEGQSLYTGSTTVAVETVDPARVVLNLLPDESLYSGLELDAYTSGSLVPEGFVIYRLELAAGSYQVLFGESTEIPEELKVVLLDLNWQYMDGTAWSQVGPGAVYIAVQNALDTDEVPYNLVVVDVEVDVEVEDEDEDEDEVEDELAYQIGDEGPAGGVIFYVNPNENWQTEDGWQFLEAAPEDVTEAMPFDPNDTYVSNTRQGVEWGALNTEYIRQQVGEGIYAANSAAQYILSDYTDWFLPSEDALLALYNEKAAVDGFADEDYWSSTADLEQAKAINFSDGSPVLAWIQAEYRVRPVRAVRDIYPLRIVAYSADYTAGVTGDLPADRYHYEPGEMADVLDSGTLFSSGNIFAEWNTDANGGGMAYSPGQQLEVGNENVHLLAQFTPYAEIDRAFITERDSLMSGDSIDHSDGNLFPTGQGAVYFTNGGNYGKMIIHSDESGVLEFSFVTYDANGAVVASEDNVSYSPSQTFNLDTDLSDDFWLQNVDGVERMLTPLGDARIYMPPR